MSDAELLDRASEALASCSNAKAAIKTIEAEAGGLAQQVVASGRDRSPTRWGLSTIMDNNTATPIVSEPVFDALHTLAGVRARYPIGNAGLMHVYGYLLSREPTPYGLERERWLEPQTALALGLERHAFAPRLLDASATPLLERVTQALEPLVARESEHGVLLGQDGSGSAHRAATDDAVHDRGSGWPSRGNAWGGPGR